MKIVENIEISRLDISAELAEAEDILAAATAALQAAEVARNLAVGEMQVQRAALAPIDVPLAPWLATRLSWAQQAARDGTNAAATAAARVAGAERAVADLRQAVEQLDVIAALHDAAENADEHEVVDEHAV